jgi:hypothetical protein
LGPIAALNFEAGLIQAEHARQPARELHGEDTRGEHQHRHQPVPIDGEPDREDLTYHRHEPEHDDHATAS